MTLNVKQMDIRDEVAPKVMGMEVCCRVDFSGTGKDLGKIVDKVMESNLVSDLVINELTEVVEFWMDDPGAYKKLIQIFGW